MTLTLECILNDTSSDSFQAFSTYLQQQYATENLMFWLAVERYRNDYMTAIANDSNDDTKDTLKTIAQQCMAIVYTHVEFNSCQEINIPCDMRHAILDKVLVDRGYECDYHPDLFIPASEAVLELMRSNSFVPWIGQRDPSMLPTPPLSDSASPTSHHRASSLVSSLSSPDGWNIVSPASSRLSISSFRSTNDTILPFFSSSHHQHHHQSQRRVGGLSYQTMLKRMKDCFFNGSSRTLNPTRRSSLTWPSTSHRKS